MLDAPVGRLLCTTGGRLRVADRTGGLGKSVLCAPIPGCFELGDQFRIAPGAFGFGEAVTAAPIRGRRRDRFRGRDLRCRGNGRSLLGRGLPFVAIFAARRDGRQYQKQHERYDRRSHCRHLKPLARLLSVFCSYGCDFSILWARSRVNFMTNSLDWFASTNGHSVPRRCSPHPRAGEGEHR